MTGYTERVADGDMSFEAFVWRCARAFGANVMMRDQSIDAPVREYQPSTWHAERAAKARKELAELEAMTDTQVAAAQRAAIRQIKNSVATANAGASARVARYRRMERKVLKWRPPTPAHEALRTFMLRQLEGSIEHDSWRMELPEMRSVADYRAERERVLRADIDYHDRNHAQEVALTAERNDWNRALAASVPPPRAADV